MAGVVVAGVGMIPFSKPGRSDDYDVMGSKAIQLALDDAGVSLDAVQQAFAGYVYGDSTCGQRALYRVGQTGIPVLNVNNNCASGASALWLARQAVQSGAADVALAFGFEQMNPGPLGSKWDDRPAPLGEFIDTLDRLRGPAPAVPRTLRFFGEAGLEYMERTGCRPETFAQFSVKSRRHAANNPYAVFRDPVTVEEVLASPTMHGALTRLQCCPPTCGAAAAVIVNAEYAEARGLRADVGIKAMTLASDTSATFTSGNVADLVGAGITRRASQQLYEQAGVDPTEIPVVELHDCFTVNEVLTYEALGLTPDGTAEKFILDGQNTYGGQAVVNPSGGLLSKGHPLGATGLAQCTELVWQLRGAADKRQVDGATLALQHNLGLGSAGVIAIYERLS